MAEIVLHGIIYKWNDKKENLVKDLRKISFINIVECIKNKKILADIPHPNQTKYPGQKKLIIEFKEYAYDVPYIQETKNSIFLKTVIPSRKSTKIYLNSKI